MNLLHRPVRMHIASVGVSKFCFLFSLVFCGLLLLLIPTLQPPARHVDLPQPRPQVKPAQAGKASAYTSQHREVPAVSSDAGDTEGTLGLNQSVLQEETEVNINDNHNNKEDTDSKRKPDTGAPHGGKVGGRLGSRSGDMLELKDLFIAVKTTRKYHKSRLELLIQTWVSKAKEQVRRHTVIY